ncbi:MAG: hypothetical protein LBR89_01880 [Holosporales bacterium]|jgi:hypothetical protein|nr:hypothetical protein [Holosporales bacterium]
MFASDLFRQWCALVRRASKVFFASSCKFFFANRTSRALARNEAPAENHVVAHRALARKVAPAENHVVAQDVLFLTDLFCVFFAIPVAAFCLEADFDNHSSAFLLKNMFVLTLVSEAGLAIFRSYQLPTWDSLPHFAIRVALPLAVGWGAYLALVPMLSAFESLSGFTYALAFLLEGLSCFFCRYIFQSCKFALAQAVGAFYARLRMPVRYLSIVFSKYLWSGVIKKLNGASRFTEKAGRFTEGAGRFTEKADRFTERADLFAVGADVSANDADVSAQNANLFTERAEMYTEGVRVLLVGFLSDVEEYLRDLDSAQYADFAPVAIITPHPLDFGKYINDIPVIGDLNYLEECVDDDAFQSVVIVGNDMLRKIKKHVLRKLNARDIKVVKCVTIRKQSLDMRMQ